MTLFALTMAMMAATAAMGAWAWQFGKRLRAEVERAARVQSEVLARDFAEEFNARNTRPAEWLMTFLRVGDDLPPHAADTLLARIDLLQACECAPVMVQRATFAWRADRPGLDVRGVDAPLARRLEGRLRELARDEPSPGPLLTVLKSDTAGVELLASIFFRRDASGVAWVVGALGSHERLRSELLEPVARHVTTLRLGELGASVVAWRIIQPGGDTLMRLGEFDADRFAVASRFWQRRFTPDSGGPSLGFLEEVPVGGPRRAPASERQDARRNAWVVLAQVSAAGMEAHLHGRGATPGRVVGILVALSLATGVMLLVLGTRLVRHTAEREAFATAVAHDLRTPLTQILLYGESIQLQRPAEQARRDAARVIVRETRRLIHIVENALAFVRGRGAPPTLHFTAIRLDTFLAEVLAGRQEHAARQGTRLTVEVPAGLAARGDATALAQVMGNLVDNALRFGPVGQHVQVRAASSGQTIFIEVDDEGPGVPPERREEIFRPFVRGSGSGGTGIGLAVSRQLAELMNGRLEVVDRPGARGARLRLELPAVAAVVHEETVPR